MNHISTSTLDPNDSLLPSNDSYLSSVLASDAVLAELNLVLTDALVEVLFLLDLLIDEGGVAGSHLFHNRCNRRNIYITGYVK